MLWHLHDPGHLLQIQYRTHPKIQICWIHHHHKGPDPFPWLVLYFQGSVNLNFSKNGQRWTKNTFRFCISKFPSLMNMNMKTSVCRFRCFHTNTPLNAPTMIAGDRGALAPRDRPRTWLKWAWHCAAMMGSMIRTTGLNKKIEQVFQRCVSYHFMSLEGTCYFLLWKWNKSRKNMRRKHQDFSWFSEHKNSKTSKVHHDWYRGPWYSCCESPAGVFFT